MNIAITGATGALGQELIRCLVENKHVVHCILRENSTIKSNKSLEGAVYLHSNSDINLHKLFSSNFIDAIVHLSTNYGYFDSETKVVEDNLSFPIRLLNIADKYKVPLFINTDTFLNKKPYQCGKLKNYVLSKKAFLLWLHGTNTTKVVTLRLEHLYGPKDREEKFFSKAMQEIVVNKSKYFEATSGLHKRDFLDIRDACSAYMHVLNNKEKINKDIYEIGTGKPTSIKDCLILIKSLSESPTEILFGALKLRPEDNFDSFSTKEFNIDFMWHSKIDLTEGILHLIQRLRLF
jgi:CDP-paratose synthetase